jgi:hypothetical protein
MPNARKRRPKMARVYLNAVGRKEVERLLAVMVLGVVDAIRHKRMTPDEGDELLFVPLLLTFMKRGRLDRRLILAVDLATELRGLEILKPKAI